MSATVDERVVSMQFDNAQFERGVQQTLNSLNNLNKTVEQTGKMHSGSFNTLITGLNGVDQKINNNIVPTMDVVNRKFSLLGTIGDQVIRNMTNSLTGLIHKGFSNIFQVNGGMKEYELKMGSIQTILNGTGESLTNVKNKLEELNKYSDDTIYSFKDMTDNIGKFTNQGVKLNDAVAAIKGIANEAALSGANAQQASHAMYNFSQALSAGYVKLIDWKSIQMSMMATKEFKETLLETATALGTVTKQGDGYITTTTNMQGKISGLFNATKGFDDSLNHQWMTSEVLTQALELYATDVTKLTEAEKEEYETKLRTKGFTDEQIKNFEDLGTRASKAATEIKTFSMLVDTAMEAIGSGWAQTFELIFGDFYEAKQLWTGIGNALGDLINRFSDARNNLLKGWKDDGGRVELLQAFVNILNSLISVVKPIKEAFNNVFGAFTSDTLLDLTKGIENFTRNLILSEEQMSSLAEKAEVFFKILKLIYDVLSPYAKQIAAFFLFSQAFSVLNGILTGGMGLGSIFAILKAIVALGIGAQLIGINGSIEDIEASLVRTKDFVVNLKDTLVNTFKTVLGFVANFVHIFISKITEQLPENFGLSDVIIAVANTLIGIFTAAISAFPKINWWSVLNVVGFAAAVKVITKIINNLKGAFTTIMGASSIIRTIKSLPGIMNPVGNAINNFTKEMTGVKKLNGIASIIKNIALLIGAFSLLIFMFANFDTASIAKASVALVGLLAAITLFTKVIISMSDNVNLKGLLALSIVFGLFVGLIITLTAQMLIFGSVIGALTLICGSADDAFMALMIPLAAMAAYFMAVLAEIALLAILLNGLGKLLPDIALGAVALLTISAALLAFSLALFPLVAMGLAVAITVGAIVIILSNLPIANIFAAAGALSLAMIGFAASMMVLSAAAQALRGANILGMVAMMLSFSIAIGVLSISMLAIQNIPWQNIVALIVGFTGAISLLTIVFALFGTAALTAIPVIATIVVAMVSFGATALVVSFGVAAIQASFALLISVLTSLLPVVQNFITFIADMSSRTKDIINSGTALADLGKNLLILAVGLGAVSISAGLMTASLIGVSAGLTVFGLSLVALSFGVTQFANSIVNAIKIISIPVQEAANWGSDLVMNFVNGIVNGISEVRGAAEAVADIIYTLWHHTTPDAGPMADDDKWGFDCIMNFVAGIVKGIPFLGSAAEAGGESVKEGLVEGSDGAGDIAASNIIGELFDKIGGFFDAGSSAGNSWLSGFMSQASKASAFATVAGDTDLSKAQKKLKKNNNDYSKLSSAEIDALRAENKRKKDNGFFSVADFYDWTSKNKSDSKNKESSSNPLGDLGGGGGAGGGSGKGGGSGSGSAKEAEEAAKKAAEAEKQHKKYLDLTTKSALAYDGVYKNLNNTLDDTKPSENAQNAIKTLAEDLYKASLTGEETAEDLAKAAENTEKVFIDMYEGIKKKTKDSLDFFKDFDKGFSDIVKPKQIMKSITSQISGNIDMTKIWKELAMRGAPSKWLKDIIENGAEALPEIRSVLQLSTDQWTKYFNAINQKENLSEFMANEAIASLALGRQVEKLKEASEVRKKYVEEGQKIINDWNSIENDGSLASQAAYDITAKRMEELAKKYGVSVEEIQKACKEVADGTVDSVDKQLAAFDKLSIAYNKWQNSFETAKNAYISGMSDFLKSFDEFKINDDDDDALSVDKIKENLKKRKEAVEQFNEDINKLIEMGLNEEKLNELVAAGPESSYETVHALAEGTKEDIADINEYLEGAQADTNNAAIAYGQNMANSIVAGFDATLLPYFEALGTKFDLSALLQKAGIDMSVVGQQLGFGIKDGIDSATPEVESSTLEMSQGVDQKAQKYINKENGYSKAENFMIGILNGIEDYKDEVLSAIEEICSAVGDVPYDEWEEGSPSRLTRKYAKWYIEGMVGGFKYYGSNAVDAVKNGFVDPIVENMKSALGTAYDILTNDGDMSPTITPVLDLSNIESGRKTLGSLMSTNGLQVNANLGTVNTPASKIDKLVGALSGNNNAQNQTGNNFNFVQNNYSPKALSRLEIYRQTKNQFAQLKGMVN